MVKFFAISGEQLPRYDTDFIRAIDKPSKIMPFIEMLLIIPSPWELRKTFCQQPDMEKKYDEWSKRATWSREFRTAVRIPKRDIFQTEQNEDDAVCEDLTV